MYIDYHLKFDSEAAAKAVLYRAEGEEANEIPKYLAIDLIGTVYKPTGKMLQSDEVEFPEMAPLPGYHANVRVLDAASELEAYQVFPKNPVRGWA
jgi:hypothetical protein